MRPVSECVNRVVTGDCVRLLRELPTASVDLVVTDPPYLVRYKDRSGRQVANDDTDAWLRPAFAELYRVLRPGRFCVSFYGWHKVDTFMSAWRGAGFTPRAHFVWPKPYASRTEIVRYSHESAYLLTKGEPYAGFEVVSDVLEWGYTGNVYHPTQKPLMALLPLIQAYSRPGEIVLDPFAGSGTTAVAAKQLDRRYIAIELDPKYGEIARERLRKVEL